MMDASEQPRPRRDLAHDLQLLRELAIINARTVQALGPLPPAGLPVAVKRKPDLPRFAPPPASAHAETKEDETMRGNPITATAALVIAGTLAACAAEPSPPIDSQPASTSISQPAAVEIQIDPAPVVVQTPAAAGATAAVASEQAEPVRGPPIPAAQLRKQILDLIGSFQTLQDLERAHVETIMGTTLVKDPEMEDGYQYFGITSEGWNYRLAVDRLHGMKAPPTILLYLNNGVKSWTDQKPTYCTLDFEELAKELVALGYERGARLRQTAGKPSWAFNKELPARNSGFGVDVYIYTLEDGSESGVSCVRSFRIGGDPLHE